MAGDMAGGIWRGQLSRREIGTGEGREALGEFTYDFTVAMCCLVGDVILGE